MTVSVSWLLERANRKLNVPGLSPEVARKTCKVIRELHVKGIYVGVAQGFRSYAEQEKLYAQGRTTPGAIVTNARGGQSNHNRGIAVDLFQYSMDGTKAIFTNDANFQQIVQAMKRQGFSWGGDWDGFKDYPHFELNKSTTDALVRIRVNPFIEGLST